MSEVSEGAELFFILLLMYVDDEGYCKANYKVMRNVLYANRDEVSVKKLMGYVGELCDAGCVTLFVNEDGRAHIRVDNFKSYQSVPKASPSKLKPLEELWERACVDDFDPTGKLFANA